MPASDIAAAAARHDPAAWTRTLSYRPAAALPFDAAALPPATPLLFDTTVYIDTLNGGMPTALLRLIASRSILHAAPALAELALAIGLLNPTDPRTPASVRIIRETLAQVPSLRVLTPTPDLWVEAATLAGILARTQGIPRPERRKLLNDALLFLLADHAGATLLTRNLRDMDLLLQIKPAPSILFYNRA